MLWRLWYCDVLCAYVCVNNNQNKTTPKRQHSSLEVYETTFSLESSCGPGGTCGKPAHEYSQIHEPSPPPLPGHLHSLIVLSFSFFPLPAFQNNLNNSCYLLRIYCLLHINIIFRGMYYYATVSRVRLLAGSLSHYYSNSCMPQVKPILSPVLVLDFRSRKIINTIFRL